MYVCETGIIIIITQGEREWSMNIVIVLVQWWLLYERSVGTEKGAEVMIVVGVPAVDSTPVG